jgi:hypothetical protein
VAQLCLGRPHVSTICKRPRLDFSLLTPAISALSLRKCGRVTALSILRFEEGCMGNDHLDGGQVALELGDIDAPLGERPFEQSNTASPIFWPSLRLLRGAGNSRFNRERP